MRSNMQPQKDFSKNPSVQNQRSVFNRTHSHKSTFDTDFLIPFYVDEILPGDSQDVKANIFARLSGTLEFPIMDNIMMDTQYFFVPYRILWDNWEKFMGAQDDPGDSIDFQIPQITEDTADEVQSLMDYMGIPPGLPYSVSSLFARGYVKIFNDWYRDENLQDSLEEFTGDGPETEDKYNLQKRGKRHDYFTSCLPFPQKGDAVTIALAGLAPVRGDGTALGLNDGTNEMGLSATDQSPIVLQGNTAALAQLIGADTVGGTIQIQDVAIGVSETLGNTGLVADLSLAQAISINDLRTAVATQHLLELDARGGTRYFEILKAHFGVTSPDSRLQRPEYLGGSSQMMNINPVTQTSESNTTEQGNQSAFATGSSRSGYSKSFVEHGMVIGLVSIRADLTYQQGINRMFSRLDRYDFYFPSFANLGEQAVLNKEIFYQNTAADDTVFGYNERWSEMRYKPSLITGRFRSDATDSLDAWHLSQDFGSLPVLNSGFIEENVPIDRVLTSTGATVPNVIFDSLIEVKHARVMPVYSVPGLKRL